MYCANCGSDQVQKLSFVYEGGVSHVNTTTRATGVGFGRGGIGIGVGGAQTRGVHMTTTALKAAPPVQKPLGKVIALAILTLFIGFAFHWVWLVTLIAAFVAYQNMQFNKNVYPGLYERWDAAYMCNRCGTIAPPKMATPKIAEPAPQAVHTIEQPVLQEKPLTEPA